MNKLKMLLKYLWCSRQYCLRYYSDKWGHNTTSNKKSGRTLLRACLRSRTQVNFAGMLAVKTEVASWWGLLFSHRNGIAGSTTVAYVAGSSVAHENQALCTQFSVTNFSFSDKGSYPHLSFDWKSHNLNTTVDLKVYIQWLKS